jgi:hypothetical protein
MFVAAAELIVSIVGVTIVGDVDSTSLPLPVFGETSVGGMMTEGMESGGFT